MYQALYRKYRPLTFDDLVGQDHISDVLENQVETGQISHAYLFSGTRGTGKTSAAKIFARAVNCESDDKKPCNRCDSCLENLEESAIDIVEIDAASNNGVDNIRDLKDRAFYQPASMRYKVYIIDEVHMLSKGAFNALLKILEEPPEHLIFILATTEPEKIPLTILSRCQKFQFNRISPRVIEKRLRYIADQEDLSMDDSVYKLIVSKADGSMRDALSVMDQLYTSGADHIDYELAIDILGLVDSNVLFDFTSAIISGSPEWINILDDIVNSGKDIDQLAVDILEHFRKLMIAKVAPNSIDRYIFTNGDKYIDQAKDLNLDFITGAMGILIDNINDSRNSNQKRSLLEISIVEIIKQGQSDETSQPSQKVFKKPSIQVESKNLEESIEDSSAKVSEYMAKDQVRQEDHNQDHRQVQEEKPSDKPLANSSDELTLDQFRRDWKDILNELRGLQNSMIHALVVESNPYSYEDGVLTLGFLEGYEFHRDKIMEEHNLENIEKTISMFYNKEVKVKSVIIDDTSQDLEEDIKNLKNIFEDDLSIL